MIKMTNKFFSGFGKKHKTHFPGKTGVELYSYKKADGTFDYEEYRKIQIAGNKNKIGNVWVIEENVSFLSDYINKNIPNVEFGICHGTRNGKEQEWFRKYLNANVIGTEISDCSCF
jgi:hypothetical protein